MDRKEAARNVVNGIPTGRIDADLLAEDFSGWTASSHDLASEVYQQRLAVIPHLFPDGLQMVIDDVTAEDDRVIVRARGKGTVLTGGRYDQHYLFYIRFSPSGKIEHIREYLDSKHAGEVLIPAIEAHLSRSR